MVEEATAIPLVNAGAFVRPGIVACCELHAVPVIVIILVIGELSILLML